MGSLAQRSLRGGASLMDAWTPGLLGVEPSELSWCLIELRHTFGRFLLFLLRFAFSVGQRIVLSDHRDHPFAMHWVDHRETSRVRADSC